MKAFQIKDGERLIGNGILFEGGKVAVEYEPCAMYGSRYTCFYKQLDDVVALQKHPLDFLFMTTLVFQGGDTKPAQTFDTTCTYIPKPIPYKNYGI